MSRNSQNTINLIKNRISVIERHRDEYQSNTSLTPHDKELASNYYRGALNELYRIKNTIEAA